MIVTAIGTGDGKPTRLVGSHIIEGMKDMTYSFVGLGLWPYIMAEMLHPDTATYKKIVERTCSISYSVYLVTAIVFYATYGQDLEHMKIYRFFEEHHTGALRTIFRYLRALKAVGAFPLAFWALLIETEQYLSMETSLAFSLRLPWAIRQHSRSKLLVRIGLVCLISFTLFVLPYEADKILRKFFIAIPLSWTHFLIPALLAMFSIRFPWKQILEQEDETDADDVGSVHPHFPAASFARDLEWCKRLCCPRLPHRKGEAYFCNNLCIHTGAAAFTLCLVGGICLTMFIQFIVIIVHLLVDIARSKASQNVPSAMSALSTNWLI